MTRSGEPKQGESSQGSSIDGSQLIEALDFEVPSSAQQADYIPPNSPQNTNSGGIQTSNKPARKSPWWHSQFNLMLAVFGLLIVTAGFFVMLIPSPTIEQQSVAVDAPEGSTSAASGQAPWTQSQLAKARADSQSILSKLLLTKGDLEKKNVQLWAPEKFEQALTTASNGDELYKQQQYVEAINQYESAYEQMQSLFEFLPAMIKSQLADGETALNEGKAELAEQIFTEVQNLDPNNQQASLGLSRAATLDQVVAMLADAQQKVAEFAENELLSTLTEAEKKLQQALKVDAKFLPASEALGEVQQQISNKRFQMAMSDAYQALFANRYGSARKSFAAALKIKPGDKTAAAALQQTQASDSTSSIRSLLQDAQAFERREEWQRAYGNYQAVLQRDPNQVSAKLGSLKTDVRQKLDARIAAALSDPLALSRSSRKTKAQQALADAKAIGKKGSKLLAQIEQLESALKQVAEPIKVQFTSDGITEVSLQKAGSKAIKLGKFTQKNLALKPGRYVATGVRNGYHDVRNEIELSPSSDGIQPVSVRCQRPIGSAANG